MLKITILMPNYNNGKYLDDCIQSILAQTHQNFNVLIVDDGSTDNSIEFLKKIVETDSRFKLILKESNSGIVDTMNTGLKNIDTKYIIRQDGDDKMHPERLEKLLHFMETNPEVDLCGSGIKLFGNSEATVQYFGNSEHNKASLIFGHNFGHASCIMKTEMIKEVAKGYTRNFPLMEDYDLAIRMRNKIITANIPDILYYYRQTDENALNNNLKKKATFLSIYSKILTELKIEDERAAAIHFEIGKKVKLTFRKDEYFKQLDLIVKSNKLLQLYPEKELEAIISEKRRMLIYRMIDHKMLSLRELYLYKFAVRYYLGAKFRKLLFFRT